MTATSFESRLDGMFEHDLQSGQRLFFVQGLWRSGTSWVGRMLDDASQVYVCPHELHSYMRMLDVRQFGEPLATSPFLQSRFNAGRKAAFLSMLMHFHRVEKPEATWIGERSPGGDVAALKEAFPRSKFIIVLRDGRDACVSQAFLARQMGTDPDCIDESSQVTLRYLSTHAAMYGQLMPEFFALKASHPDDVLLLRYEDLRADPLAGMSAAFECLQLNLDQAAVAEICRRHEFAADAKHTAKRDSGHLWMRRGEVGNWRQHLSPASAAVYEELAHRALEMAGYAVTARPRRRPSAKKLLSAASSDLSTKVSGAFDKALWRGRGLFFVQGLWSSGSEQVCRLLTDGTTAYVCPHQLQGFMREFGRSPMGWPYSGNTFVATRAALIRKAGFLTALLRMRDLERPYATLIGDHSPGADVARTKIAFPLARQIIVLRDGRDLCAPGISLRDVVWQAVLYSTFVSDYMALQAEHPAGVLLVKYEDVQKDPTGYQARMADFLGIVAAPAGDGVQPWSDNTPQMDPASLAAFEMIAEPALQQAGYALTGEPATPPLSPSGLMAFRDVFDVLNDLETVNLATIRRQLLTAATEMTGGRSDIAALLDDPPPAGRRKSVRRKPRRR